MPLDLAIRLANGDDTDAVLRLLGDCTDAMRATGIDQWDEVYPSRATIVADVQSQTLHLGFLEIGTLVGAFVLNEYQNPQYSEVPWTINDSRIAVVHRLMVHPHYQGKGVARELMAFAEAYARDQGYGAIRLDAFTANPRALRLYTGLGYRDAGGVTFRKGPFRCFEKKLEGSS
jgi:GNAT superfamily N-acetyltransferase